MRYDKYIRIWNGLHDPILGKGKITMSDSYILDGQTPVREPDLLKWGHWMREADRVVKEERRGPYNVSTVFLGIDHNFSMSGPPVLFETMVFNKSGDDVWCERATTWELALGTHAKALAWVDSGGCKS